MEYAEFEALVRRLEREADARPAWYRTRVLGLSLLGYGYVFAVLALALVLAAAVVAMIVSGTGRALFFKFGWILAIFVWSVGSALWVRIDPPEGLRIRKEDAPELFALVDATRKRLRAPRPHVVLAQNDVNAAISQVPRLGILGWQRNYLMLGLPLMRSLSAAEFEAVLAHEFGHLAGSHGRFGTWIYRQRSFWSRILPKLEEKESVGASLFRRFLEWFTPYFQAYTFVLGRLQEYEADRAAAEGGSPRTMADALVRVELAAHRVAENFWPSVGRAMRQVPEAPARLFVDLGERLQQGERLGEDAASDEVILENALQVETTLGDTHPALRDRLAALGTEPRVPPLPERSAAQELLGETAVRLETEFSGEWRKQVGPGWGERFEAAEKDRQRIRELESNESRSSDETWELACLLSDERRIDEAYAHVLEVLRLDPDNAAAQRTWGLRLVAEGDDEGLHHLERALELSEDGTLDVCRAAYRHLHEQEREQEAQVWAERARAFHQRMERARAERASFAFDDAVEPHGVPDGNLDGLRAQLADRKPVRRAWLVRKKVELYPEEPAFVLVLELSGRWHRTRRQLKELLGEYAATLRVADDWFCVSSQGLSRKQRKRILGVAGEPFYERSRHA